MDTLELNAALAVITNNSAQKNMTFESDDSISADNAIVIATALATDNHVETLDLTKSMTGAGSSQGLAALAHTLTVNKTLKVLILEAAWINAEGLTLIANALPNNNTLVTLNVSANSNIMDAGVIALAKALEKNDTLTTLGLGAINMTDVGAQALLNALQENDTLTEIELQYNNQIDQKILQKIHNRLAENKENKKPEVVLAKIKDLPMEEFPGKTLKKLKSALAETTEDSSLKHKLIQAIVICEIHIKLHQAGIAGMRQYHKIAETSSAQKRTDLPPIYQAAVNQLDSGYLAVARQAFADLSAIQADDPMYETAQHALSDLWLDLGAIVDKQPAQSKERTILRAEMLQTIKENQYPADSKNPAHTQDFIKAKNNKDVTQKIMQQKNLLNNK